MPPAYITLEDCMFEKSDDRITMVLPVTIDVSNITPLTIFGDHHLHYPNQHGDLVIACDYVARFYRPEDRINKFRSEWSWSDHKGKTFYFDRWPDIEYKIDGFPSSHAGDIVMGIPELTSFANQFLRWVNEFQGKYQNPE